MPNGDETSLRQQKTNKIIDDGENVEHDDNNDDDNYDSDDDDG